MKKSRSCIRRYIFLRNISILLMILGMVFSARVVFDSVTKYAGPSPEHKIAPQSQGARSGATEK